MIVFKFAVMARIILIACLILLLLTTAFEFLPLHVDDDLSFIQQAELQAAISQRIAKDVLILEYQPTSMHVQAVSELQNMLPVFERRQASLATEPTITLILPTLTDAQSDFVSIDVALKSILANDARPVDPIQVQIIQLHERSYFLAMTQVATQIQQEGEEDKIQILTIEVVLNGMTGALLVLLLAYSFVLLHRAKRSSP
jgi:hypothetical protein